MQIRLQLLIAKHVKFISLVFSYIISARIWRSTAILPRLFLSFSSSLPLLSLYSLNDVVGELPVLNDNRLSRVRVCVGVA